MVKHTITTITVVSAMLLWYHTPLFAMIGVRAGRVIKSTPLTRAPSLPHPGTTQTPVQPPSQTTSTPTQTTTTTTIPRSPFQPGTRTEIPQYIPQYPINTPTSVVVNPTAEEIAHDASSSALSSARSTFTNGTLRLQKNGFLRLIVAPEEVARLPKTLQDLFAQNETRNPGSRERIFGAREKEWGYDAYYKADPGDIPKNNIRLNVIVSRNSPNTKIIDALIESWRLPEDAEIHFYDPASTDFSTLFKPSVSPVFAEKMSEITEQKEKSAELKAKKALLEALKAKEELARQTLHELEQEQQSAEQKIQEAQQEVDQKLTELNQAQQNVNAPETAIINSEKKINDLIKQQTEIEQQEAALKKRIEELKQAEDQAFLDLLAHEFSTDINAASEQALQSWEQQMLQEEQLLQKAIVESDKKLSDLNSSLAQADKDIAELEAEQKKNQEKQQSLAEAHNELQTEIETRTANEEKKLALQQEQELQEEQQKRAQLKQQLEKNKIEIQQQYQQNINNLIEKEEQMLSESNAQRANTLEKIQQELSVTGKMIEQEIEALSQQDAAHSGQETDEKNKRLEEQKAELEKINRRYMDSVQQKTELIQQEYNRTQLQKEESRTQAEQQKKLFNESIKQQEADIAEMEKNVERLQQSYDQAKLQNEQERAQKQKDREQEMVELAQQTKELLKEQERNTIQRNTEKAALLEQKSQQFAQQLKDLDNEYNAFREQHNTTLQKIKEQQAKALADYNARTQNELDELYKQLEQAQKEALAAQKNSNSVKEQQQSPTLQAAEKKVDALLENIHHKQLQIKAERIPEKTEDKNIPDKQHIPIEGEGEADMGGDDNANGDQTPLDNEYSRDGASTKWTRPTSVINKPTQPIPSSNQSAYPVSQQNISQPALQPSSTPQKNSNSTDNNNNQSRPRWQRPTSLPSPSYERPYNDISIGSHALEWPRKSSEKPSFSSDDYSNVFPTVSKSGFDNNTKNQSSIGYHTGSNNNSQEYGGNSQSNTIKKNPLSLDEMSAAEREKFLTSSVSGNPIEKEQKEWKPLPPKKRHTPLPEKPSSTAQQLTWTQKFWDFITNSINRMMRFFKS